MTNILFLIVLGQNPSLRPSLGAQAPECEPLCAEPNYCPYTLASLNTNSYVLNQTKLVCAGRRSRGQKSPTTLPWLQVGQCTKQLPLSNNTA